MENTLSRSKINFKMLPTHIGAGIGFLTCALIGAIPGVLYGGYMGLAMTTALFGNSIAPTVLAKGIVGGGMVLGLTASMFFFLVLGAFLGTLLGLPFAKTLARMNEVQTAEIVAVHE